MRFEWDEEKNLANQAKHGLSFAEARELFTRNEDYLLLFDAAHSEDEERFIGIGPTPRGVVLVVWTEPEEEVVRIISARLATKRERERYVEYAEGRA